MKEKIIRAINHRTHQLRNNGNNPLSRMEIKLAEATMNIVWAASLVKTSLTVTKTPTTTLKSILKANLNLKNGKVKANRNSQIVGDKLNGDINELPLQILLHITQRMM